MKTIASILAVVLAAAAVPALAEGSNVVLPVAPINRLDNESLQRGARTFVNYCLTCHTAKYMRYNRLTDIGLSEQEIKDNLILTGAKIGDTMTISMPAAEAKAWFGAAPPDLSVEARVRGADWLYNYLDAFYRDPKSATGWNNLVFHNVGMPHVLAQLQGTRKAVETEYEDHEKAQAAAIGVKGLVGIEPAAGGKWMVTTLVTDTPGSLTEVQYQAAVADLVNYMDYMSEPAKNDRVRLGMLVLLFLGVLFVFAWLLKHEYWRDVH